MPPTQLPIPNPLLTGEFDAVISDSASGDPTNVIRREDAWSVRCTWHPQGPVRRPPRRPLASRSVRACVTSDPVACPRVWLQRTFALRARPRGAHLVTREVVEALPEIRDLRVGLAHVLILHTSASLALNENASPDVRADLAAWLDRAVPDGAPYFRHTLEGPDDMPAHVKSVLTGPSLTLPVTDGHLALGTWQGIYLCEHRDRGGARSVTATLWGEADQHGD
jgi:secondary thiamine-phosphate synthase enzyme